MHRSARFACIAAAAALAFSATPAAADTGLSYVNMGDSYSAGSGIFPLAPGISPLCAQSTKNWGHDLAAAKGYELTDVSCGGATTSHFEKAQYPGTPPQLDALSEKTDVVTLTIGGNDENTFAGAAAACALAAVPTLGQGSPCKTLFGDGFATTIKNKVAPNITRALKAVKAKAPNARVAISGYLQILPPTGGCFPLLPIANGDVPYLHGIQQLLNDSVRNAAEQTGAVYVDVSEVSTGHDACQNGATRWVEPLFGANGLSLIHPNATGEKVMAEQAAKALAGS
ncbi:SGNH/GDSL hydrolase family protein [Amycolatopsis sp. CA-230715]|uniref:SGNH/GDSL hydrolase family protein n=1 Tax=Amycolatopsis sp. CA-230715 TaxID=2745196 RepID=UPI001C00B8E5|nr:SGNH/GDSL hydrolase family protein [Amycolatopsis sp. CA-230715]QWF77746.1 Lipase 2 [Amycolatopsis sp. CA-230715]